jgi:hypothetical protein
MGDEPGLLLSRGNLSLRALLCFMSSEGGVSHSLPDPLGWNALELDDTQRSSEDLRASKMRKGSDVLKDIDENDL